jgi:hypothetical protein
MAGLAFEAVDVVRRLRTGIGLPGGTYFDLVVSLSALVIGICLLRPNLWVRVLAAAGSILFWTYCGSLLLVVGGSLDPLAMSANCLGIALAAYTLLVVWSVAAPSGLGHCRTSSSTEPPPASGFPT